MIISNVYMINLEYGRDVVTQRGNWIIDLVRYNVNFFVEQCLLQKNVSGILYFTRKVLSKIFEHIGFVQNTPSVNFVVSFIARDKVFIILIV